MTTPSKVFLTLWILLVAVWSMALPAASKDNPLWEVAFWIAQWLLILDSAAWLIYCVWFTL